MLIMKNKMIYQFGAKVSNIPFDEYGSIDEEVAICSLIFVQEMIAVNDKVDDDTNKEKMSIQNQLQRFLKHLNDLEQ